VRPICETFEVLLYSCTVDCNDEIFTDYRYELSCRINLWKLIRSVARFLCDRQTYSGEYGRRLRTAALIIRLTIHHRQQQQQQQMSAWWTSDFRDRCRILTSLLASVQRSARGQGGVGAGHSPPRHSSRTPH